jgi:histidinol-phosphate aminotransferase
MLARSNAGWCPMTSSDSWRAHLRPSLDELSIYDVPPADRSVARLHANECPLPWPPAVMDAVGEAIRGVELGRYPDTSGRRVRRLLGERHGCDPDRIVLGNGSDEVISFLVTALSGRGGAVVIPTPTFVMYGHAAKVMDLPVREVPLDDAFELQEATMDAALPGAALCFLARPNNPTGNVWDASVIRRLVAGHPETVFVVDEAYAAYDPGCSLYSPDSPDNQVHMTTLSKVGGAAMRLGYAIATPELATAMNKVRHPYNVSATTLAIAEVLLTRFEDEQAAMVQEALALRDRLRAVLQQVPGGQVLPTGANLMLLRLEPKDAAPRLWAHLRDEGVWVKDVSKVPGLEGCLRVSLGTDAELDRLDAALRAWPA